jgi:DNA adenine methylase/adenine-specific DNA-methyltransferase
MSEPRLVDASPHVCEVAPSTGRVLPPFVELAAPPLLVESWIPPRAEAYPEFRYMGSKHRLLPWLARIFARLDFETAADPFVGSGSVSYLLKAMGREIHASDFLNFPTTIAAALIENSTQTLSSRDIEKLLDVPRSRYDFIERTFDGIFFSTPELRFLDDVWANLGRIRGAGRRALVLTALIRACMKRQPRGVFTVANHSDGSARYDDGRRDMRLTLREHFVEQVALLNGLVFDNGRSHTAERRDVFSASVIERAPDLVYLDPPYVPRADDNCYVKRYHFLEGLSCYWRGVRIMPSSKVRKIEKPYTPFSYRRDAEDAFDRLFARYASSIIVLSYSTNGYPDQTVLCEILGRYKRSVTVHECAHRYHFGTHAGVGRAETTEYVLVGSA